MCATENRLNPKIWIFRGCCSVQSWRRRLQFHSHRHTQNNNKIHTNSYFALHLNKYCNGTEKLNVNKCHSKQFSLIQLHRVYQTTHQTKRTATMKKSTIEKCFHMQLPNGNNAKLLQIAAVAARSRTETHKNMNRVHCTIFVGLR